MGPGAAHQLQPLSWDLDQCIRPSPICCLVEVTKRSCQFLVRPSLIGRLTATVWTKCLLFFQHAISLKVCGGAKKSEIPKISLLFQSIFAYNLFE